MKKKLLFIVPILLFSSCSTSFNKVQLTFGSYVDEEALQITPEDFDTKISNNENFLLTIYPKDTICGCWRDFSYIINKAVKDNHLMIYKYYVEDIDNSASMKEIGGFYRNQNYPTFYILEEGKLVKSYNYNKESPIFKGYDSFLQEIDTRCYEPKIMQINEEYYNSTFLAEKVIYFSRGTCSDCNYATPYALVPYYKNNQNKDSILYMDIDVFKKESSEVYQEKKDDFLLSTKNNPVLGFGNGVVPTFQYYLNDELADMCVYFNDGKLTYNEENDCYYATGSYYNSERIKYFNYLEKCEHRNLTEVAINKEDVTPYGTWKNEAAAKYYNDILYCFLDTYLKTI